MYLPQQCKNVLDSTWHTPLDLISTDNTIADWRANKRHRIPVIERYEEEHGY